MRKLQLLCAALVVIGLGYSTAFAFPFNRSWHEAASGVAGTNRAGAGGIYGTGGRTDHGIKCSHCHIEPEGMIDVEIVESPAFGSMGGEDTYSPGQRYTITVNMTGEHLMGPSGSNLNHMALTIENASGQVAGRFIADAGQDSTSCPSANPYANEMAQPAGATTFMYGDCHGVLSLEGRMPALTSWTFDWVAPAAGAGDLNMFVGVVDGDTGGESSLDDDVVERTIPLIEGT